MQIKNSFDPAKQINKEEKEILTEESPICEMFDIDDVQGLKIKIYKNDIFEDRDDVPHFHCENTFVHKECCLSILHPTYVKHDDEDDDVNPIHIKNDRLNKEELSVLINWLHEKNRYLPEYTNYQIIICFWNMNNDLQVRMDNKCPDYELLLKK